MTLPETPLLVVTDRKQARLPLFEIADRACASGCRWISLREKDLTPQEQVALAVRLRSVVRRHPGARLTVHGDPEVAAAAGGDGVHLAARSDPGPARAALGPEALVGLSVHTIAEAAAVDATSVDYVVAGPSFASDSKPGYGPVLGAAGIAAIVRASPVPVIAIGGIDASLMGELLRAGARGVAVMGSVMRADAPERVVAGLVDLLSPGARELVPAVPPLTHS